MVPVKKPIIAAKANETSAPQQRRPRNTELNSSKKPLTGKICTAGRNPFARKLNCSKLVGSTFDGKTYDEARKILMADELGYEQLWDYFGEYMPKIGAEIGKNVDMQYGETADVFFNTMVECATEAEFVKAVQDQLQEYRDLCVEDVNSSTDQSVNCTKGITWRSDKDMLESINDALSEATAEPGYSEHAYLDDDAEIQFFVGQYNPSDNTVRVSSADNKSWFRDGVPADAKEILKYAKEYIAWREENGKEGELDSACGGKDKLNSSESDTVMITTESGNELPITSIKLVQNPDTNELALYVPENEDDEIPEGFAVVGTVISDTGGTPAIEENVDSAKKDSMNCSVEGIDGLEQLPDGEDGYKEYKYRGYTIYCPPDSELDDPADPQKYVIQRKPGDAWGPYTLEECVGQVDSWESGGVNSSKSGMNCSANLAQRRHPNHRKLNSAKRRRK